MGYPVFASGDVLAASDMNAVGLWKISSTTIGSAVSSVPVTGVFSSSYANYRIIISGGTASTLLDLRLQLGSTTTGYYWTRSGWTYSNPGVANAVGAANTTSFTIGAASNSPGYVQAIVDLMSPNLADETFYNGTFALPSTTGYNGVTGGFLNDTTQYTSFTILTSTGTLTGGTIRVYGYRD